LRHLTLTLGSGGEPLISEADEDHDSMSMQVLTDLPQHDSTVLLPLLVARYSSDRLRPRRWILSSNMLRSSSNFPPEKAGLLAIDTELKDPEDQSPIRSPTVSKTLAVQNEVFLTPHRGS
jgi:hypothetical protein